MAGIDYTIPLQFKGVQLESPMNAMANAMQLRQLQESSEMNALRRQDAQEMAQLRREELQFRTQEAKAKQEERQRTLSKEQLAEAITELSSYGTIADVRASVAQKVASGLVTQAQANKVLAGLPKNDFDLPAWQIRTMRSLLPVKEQYAELKAARDAAYEDYMLTETYAGREPLPRDAWERRTAPAAAAPVAAPAAETAPAPATAAPVAAPAAEAAPAPAPALPTYDEYVRRALETDETILPREVFEAQQTQPAPANVLAAKAAPQADVTPPVNQLAVNPPVTVATDGTGEKVYPRTEVKGDLLGFDYLDPQAQKLYAAAAKVAKSNPKQAEVFKATADKMQAAHEKRLAQRNLTGDFLNVLNAEREIAELEKQEQTPLVKRQIATLREQIKGTTKGRSTNVVVGADKQQTEFEKKLGSGQAEKLLEDKTKAEDARDMLDTVRIGRDILKSSVITGAGADFFVGLNQALKAAGVDFGYADASANSQAYSANMAQNVGKLIKLFGAGTGLSDADRAYAEKMAGGKIALDKKALEKILDIQDRAARNVIKRYNKKVVGIKTNIPLEVELEPENVAPAPSSSSSTTNQSKPAGVLKTLSPEDKQALNWAKANPEDPRSAEIKKRLGVK